MGPYSRDVDEANDLNEDKSINKNEFLNFILDIEDYEALLQASIEKNNIVKRSSMRLSDLDSIV